LIDTLDVVISEAYVCVEEEVREVWIFGADSRYGCAVAIDQKTGDIINLSEVS